MTDDHIARAPNVVWRLAPDRLLVRFVDGRADAARDVLGAAVLVWLVLDQPYAVAELAALLGDEVMSADELNQALCVLVAAGLVVAAP